MLCPDRVVVPAGSPGVLPQSKVEVYLWPAVVGLVKTVYAVVYFSEAGIVTLPDTKEWVLCPVLTGTVE